MNKTLAIFFVGVFSVLIMLLAQVFTVAEPPPDVVNPKVTVRLQSIKLGESIPLEISGRWQMIDTRNGNVLIERDNFQGNLLCDITGPQLGAYASNRDDIHLSFESESSLRLNYFSYPGELIIEVERDGYNQPKKMQLFLKLDLEDYVLGVICGELPSQTPNIGAALAAQAIAARTYAIYKIQQGKRLRGDSRDQVYVGSDHYTQQARDAVHLTSGLVLKENAAILPSFFHRNCGGGTADAQQADFSKIYLQGLSGNEDTECADVYQRWMRNIDVNKLDNLSSEFKLGDSLLALNTVTKDKYQRRLMMRLQGKNGHRDVTGEFVRARLGLPSMVWHALIINPDGSITITGSGYGHGIGLCQEGAMRRATQGADYSAILQHYYPGAEAAVLTAKLFNQ